MNASYVSVRGYPVTLPGVKAMLTAHPGVSIEMLEADRVKRYGLSPRWQR